MRVRALLLTAGGTIGALTAAELLSLAADDTAIPRVSHVLATAVGLAADATFRDGVASTVGVWGIGLLLGAVGGAAAGVLIGSVPRIEAATRVLVEGARSIPAVVLIPPVAALATSQIQVPVTVIACAAIWPMLINTIYGMGQVDAVAKQTLRVFGFGPLARLVRLSLPSAAPLMLTGLRIAASIALIVAVSAEMVGGGQAGIGVFMLAAQAAFRVDLVAAAVVWAGILGLVADTLLVHLHRRALPWDRVRPGQPA